MNRLPYSIDLRQRVFVLLAKGKSKLFIEENLGVSTKTILKWQKHYEEIGSMKKITPEITKPRRLDYKEVQEFIEKNPNKTLREIGRKFGVEDTNISYVVKKLNIAYEKTLTARGKNGRFERALNQIF